MPPPTLPPARRASAASSATVTSNLRANVSASALATHRERARNGTHPLTNEVNDQLAAALDPPARVTAIEAARERQRLERARAAAASRQSGRPEVIEDDTVDADGNLISLQDARMRRKAASRVPACAQGPVVKAESRATRPFTPAHDADDASGPPLTMFDEHFAGAFRPLSVCSEARRSRAATPAVAAGGANDGPEEQTPAARAATPGASSALAASQRRKDNEVLKQRIAVEASQRRKQARAYIRNVTETLRQDDSLRAAFGDRVDAELRRRARYGTRTPPRAESPGSPQSPASPTGSPRADALSPDLGAPELPHNLRLKKHESVAESTQRRREAEAEHRRQHHERCAKAYEAKQEMLLQDYLRYEHDLEVTRGERFSRPRFFLCAIAAVNAGRVFGAIVQRARKETTHRFAASVVMERHGSVDGGVPKPVSQLPRSSIAFSQSRRRTTVAMPPGKEGDDIVMGVHREKFWAVDRRREEVKHFDVTPEMTQLLQRLGPRFTFALHCYNKRRKERAIALITEFAQRVRETARVRWHVRMYLRSMHLIVHRWREAFQRERERVRSVTRQMEHYFAERCRYDRDVCAMAERELRSRERSVAKANMQRRQTVAQAESALSPLREKRRKTRLANLAGDLFAEDETAKFSPRRRPQSANLTELQIAKLIAAPFMTPNPFGKRLGDDPVSSRLAGQVTLQALKTDRITWRLPERTKEFVVKYLVARERIAFAAKVAQWSAAMRESRKQLDGLIFAAQMTVGSAQERLKAEIAAWEFPKMPRRQVLLRPNEMRFWVHVAVALYAQERRTSLENGIRTDKYLDPAAIEATYNARNVLAVFNKAVATLGVRLSNVRPGYFEEMKQPIEIPLPVVPNHLLHPSARQADGAAS